MIYDITQPLFEGNVTAVDAEKILEKAKAAGTGKRILIKGKSVVTLEASKVFAAAGADGAPCRAVLLDK